MLILSNTTRGTGYNIINNSEKFVLATLPPSTVGAHIRNREAFTIKYYEYFVEREQYFTIMIEDDKYVEDWGDHKTTKISTSARLYQYLTQKRDFYKSRATKLKQLTCCNKGVTQTELATNTLIFCVLFI